MIDQRTIDCDFAAQNHLLHLREKRKAMETISKQANIKYQTRSLIDFLLGDGIHPGWLDEQSNNPSLHFLLAPREGNRTNLV